MKASIIALVACLGLIAAACGGDDDDVASDPSSSGTPAPTLSPGTGQEITLLPTASVTFDRAGGDDELVSLTVEIADDQAERSRGLMFREELAEDEGMIFVWPGDQSGSFWMRNTLVPLSIAFVLEDGSILHIEDMQPLTDDQHTAPSAYRYAIEVNQGWYADNGIEVGDSVDISEVERGTVSGDPSG